jgi:Leucine-rich repeat (LRR) protein
MEDFAEIRDVEMNKADALDKTQTININAPNSPEGSDMTPAIWMLVFLSLADCGLASTQNLPPMPNLRFFYLANNQLTSFSLRDVRHVTQLRVLRLTGNRIMAGSLFSDVYNVPVESADLGMTSSVDNVSNSTVDDLSFATSKLVSLDVSRMKRATFCGDMLQALKGIRLLNLSHTLPHSYKRPSPPRSAGHWRSE